MNTNDMPSTSVLEFLLPQPIAWVAVIIKNNTKHKSSSIFRLSLEFNHWTENTVCDNLQV